MDLPPEKLRWKIPMDGLDKAMLVNDRVYL